MRNIFLKSKFLILLFAFISCDVIAKEVKFKYESLTTFSDVIWGFDFLNEEEALLTLRDGQLWKFNIKTKVKKMISGVPPVHASGQGGLLDVRVHPLHKDIVYLTYATKKSNEGARTTFGRAQLVADELKNFKVILDTESISSASIHFGSRIEFDEDQNIYISIGDRNEREEAQNLKQHNGKVLKLSPVDKNQIKTTDYTVEVFTFGHRNPQGLALHPKTKKLWLSEFGPRGGDELNLLEKGKNYGWPDVTYGREYYGPSIGVKEKSGIEQPKVYWVPSISPSGIAFYTGQKFPEWKENLFIANLSGQHLRRIVIEGSQVLSQEELLTDKKERFRNVRSGPDGYIYLSTDSGHFSRLTP